MAAYIAFSALGFILIVLYNYGMALSKYSISVHRLFARLLHDLMYTVGQAPYYLIFFAFGYLLVKSPQFCRDMLSGYKVKIFALLLGVALIAIIYLNYGVAMLQEYEPWQSAIPTLMAGAKAIFAPSACAIIIKSTMKIRTMPSYILMLSKASYTMYVMHFAVIIVTINVLALSGFSGIIVPIVVVPATLAITFLFHMFVVERMPILKLLINGTPYVRARTIDAGGAI